MNKDLTEVVFILDCSGSMCDLRKDVVGGFNSTIAEQKHSKKKTLVSTVLFNNCSKVIHNRLPIEEIDDMKLKDYYTKGSTALIDALGDSIKYIKKVHRIIREEDIPSHTLFVITTDGLENSSHKYSSNDVKKMIQDQQKKGWEFVYLAANIDAVETSEIYGFKANRSHNFINDSVGNKKVFKTISSFMNVMNECDEFDEMDKHIEKSRVFEEIDKDYIKRNEK